MYASANSVLGLKNVFKYFSLVKQSLGSILFSVPSKHLEIFYNQIKYLFNIICSPEMFRNVVILKLAAELIKAVLAVVSAVTPHAAGNAPLALTQRIF